MVKIAAVADVHVGNRQRFARGTERAGVNLRARLIVDVLRDACTVAADQSADVLVIPGDLFDVVRPEPQLLAEVQKALSVCSENNVDVHIVVGNHEQASSEPGDHALGPLEPVAQVHERPAMRSIHSALSSVWEQESERVEAYLLPYSPELPGSEYVQSAIAQLELMREGEVDEGYPAARDRMLFAHLGVEDSGTPVWLRGAHDSIKATDLADLMRRAGISCAIVGNWHDHRVWSFDDGVEIVQCGALAPTGFDNPSTGSNLGTNDPYGSLIIWDSSRPRGARCERIVINGPRFVQGRSTRAVVDAIEEGVINHGHTVFARLVVSPDAVISVRQEFERMTTCQVGSEYHYEVVADADDVKRRVTSAAISARDATTTDSAIAEYVAAMPLDEDIDRQAVLDTARRCVAGGAS